MAWTELGPADPPGSSPEFAGPVKFGKSTEGLNRGEVCDEVTGLSTLVVIDPQAPRLCQGGAPQVKLIDAQGNEVKIPGTDHSVTIGFQVGALIQVRDGQGREAPAKCWPASRSKGQDARHHRRSAAWAELLRPARPGTRACWPR